MELREEKPDKFKMAFILGCYCLFVAVIICLGIGWVK